MNKTEEFMKVALKLGEEALEAGEVPVGCIFVRNGKVVAKAKNKTNETLNATMHAEMVALRGMSSDELAETKNMDLYVSIEPCLMCAAALRQVGIRHVYFGAFNEKFGGNGSVFNLHRDQSPFSAYKVTCGILAEEAIFLLRRFYVRENEHAPVPRKKTGRQLKEVEKIEYSVAGARKA